MRGLPLHLVSRQIVQERTKARPGSLIPAVIHGLSASAPCGGLKQAALCRRRCQSAPSRAGIGPALLRAVGGPPNWMVCVSVSQATSQNLRRQAAKGGRSGTNSGSLILSGAAVTDVEYRSTAVREKHTGSDRVRRPSKFWRNAYQSV